MEERKNEMSKNVEMGHTTEYTKKKVDVPVDEVLEMAGCGWYTCAVVLTGGLNIFSSAYTILLLSFVLPATDCDLHLTVRQKGALTSMMFTGMVFTTHLSGFISDQKGRKSVSMACNFASGILNTLAAFAPDFHTLSIIIFLNGIATAGIMVPAYVFVGECVPMKIRSFLIAIAGAIGNSPSAVLPALALVLIPMNFHIEITSFLTFTPWRAMLLTAVVPSVLSATLYMFLYESPKYLLSKGRHDEALKALRYIYTVNTGCSKEEFPVKSICLDDDETNSCIKRDSNPFRLMWNQTSRLFRKPLFKFFIISCSVQAGMYGACSSIFLWLPQIATQMTNYFHSNPNADATLCEIVNLKKSEVVFNTSSLVDNSTFYQVPIETCTVHVPTDAYYASLVVGIGQVIFYCVSGELTRWFGCKKPIVVCIIIPIVLSSFLNHVTHVWASIAIQGIMAVSLAAGIPLTIGLNVEYFPTSVRSMANCMCMMVGRICSSLGPQIIGLLQENHCEASYYGMGVYLIGICALALLLPSTEKEEDTDL